MKVIVAFEQSDYTVDVCNVVKVMTVLKKIEITRVNWILWIVRTECWFHTIQVKNMKVDFEMIGSFLHGLWNFFLVVPKLIVF